MPRKKKLIASETRIQHVALYIRVSTDEQAESGLGIEAQKTRCRAMAIASGYEEDIVLYVDEGVSGTKHPTKRKECARMLEDVQAGKVKAVIVSGLDRLARKMSYVLTLTEDFAARGVAFVSCKEKFDTSTPQGQFVLHMFAALGELERGMISQRTKEALTEKGKQDGEKGGRLPYAYVRVFVKDEATSKGHAVGIEVDEGKAGTVRRIFQLRDQGLAMHKIADRLPQQPTPAQGGKWYASSIREILLNEQAYRGGLRGESDVAWPTILHNSESAAD